MLDPFAHLFQHCWGHARSLRIASKALWVVSFPRCTAGPNIVGSCCIRLQTTANTDATTPNNVESCCVGLHPGFTRSFMFKGYLNNPLNLFSGAFDALLKWPFDYRVTFYLLDQDDDHTHRKHIKFTIKPNPCPENEPFLGRPKLEKNASFGGAKFAKHEEIETRNYLKDDTIFLKIAIECDGLSEP